MDYHELYQEYKNKDKVFTALLTNGKLGPEPMYDWIEDGAQWILPNSKPGLSRAERKTMITVNIEGAGCVIERIGPPCEYAAALDEALSSLKAQGVELAPAPSNASRCSAIWRFRTLVNGGNINGCKLRMSLADVFLA